MLVGHRKCLVGEVTGMLFSAMFCSFLYWNQVFGIKSHILELIFFEIEL